ncbi:hypothetical protein MVI01_72180 [Myxococcus virescens]|uniref:RCC1-like domain-containing protein n=1 Tax=Myxococcus virescens TaxID=83456 RepID=A0A511HPZ9_9BACT|nr:hypothetical protein MVI01_72180 [Myxococcus virescens]
MLLALGLVLVLAGCEAQTRLAPEGSAQVVVTVPWALSANDVTRVELTVSGAGMTTRTDALVKTGEQWGGVLGQLPAGPGRHFSAQAFDSSNTVRYSGEVTSVTIQAGQTAAVTLLMQEVNAPPPFDNAAPRILSLVVSLGTVSPGGQVALYATADDPNAEDTLTIAWTASTGSFSAPSSLTSTWTAPATPGQVVLMLTVTDSKGASTSLSATVTVSTGIGQAAVNVSFNTWPIVARVTALPSSVAVGQATQVMASASDSDGDALSYQWTASCAGTWADANSATASFTPSGVPSGGTCKLTVIARDGRGGQGQGSLTIYVSSSPGSARFPPEVVESFQSVASMPAVGGTVVFRARAKDAQGSALTFTWATSTGTLGTPTSTATTSEVLWTAPFCVTEGSLPTVTATVTNALGLSASYVFALQGGAVCSAAVSGGWCTSFFLKEDGTLWAWGRNEYGQLGDGTTTARFTPVQVHGLTGVAAVAAGNSSHSAALKADGTVWTWGYNGNGALGDGTTTNRATPAQVQGLTGVVAVAVGGHTVAVKSDGTVWAWGWNEKGQLGDGTTTGRLTPVQVKGLTGVVAVAATSYHTVAVKSDGTVWAWGWNEDGQLGDGTTTDRLTPVQVQGLTGVTAVAVGYYHNVALRSDGTVWAWGWNNYGQLGDGATTNRSAPVQVQELTGVLTVAGGAGHSVALKSDGTVWSWGSNTYGQLGDGAWTNSFVPVKAQNLTGVVAVSTHSLHTLAMRSDGTVWAWGLNAHGELGEAPETYRSTPGRVQGF